MNIEYDQNTWELSINGSLLATDDGETYFVEKTLLRGVRLAEMPVGVYFEICDRIGSELICRDTIIPYRVYKESDNTAIIVFEDLSAADAKEDASAFLTRMRAKRDVVSGRITPVGDISLEQYEEKDRYVYMRFVLTLTANTFDTVLQQAENIAAEIERLVARN